MLGVLALMGGMLLGQAGAAADEGLGLEVRRLVRQLDAPQLARREEAEQELIRLGPKVLDLLPQSPDRMSAEVAQRIGRIRQRLQRLMAESAGQASRVTLQGKIPLPEILSKIEEQTGNKIVFRGRPVGPEGQGDGPALDVDFDNTPFWEALDQVLQQAGLAVYPFGEEKAVSIVPRPPSASPAGRIGYSGPFRFEPVSILAVRDLRSGTASLRLTLEVSWEPRLAPVSLQQPMADVQAVDENGKALTVDVKGAAPEVPVLPGLSAVTLEIPFELPSREVKSIARLQGKLTALLPGKVEEFRFGDLEEAEQVEKRVAGVTVVLEQVRKNRAVWEIRLGVRFDEAGDALESHRTWIYDNEVYLEAADGESVEWATFETTRQMEDEIGAAYYFAVDGPLSGYTLVYKTPALILSKEIEYEIGSIELP